MTINKIDFEIGYKKLEAAFGTSINRRRLDAYYDELAPILTDSTWSDIVRKVTRTHAAFPKLHELLDLIGPVRTGNRPKAGEEFVNDDCKVIECIGGVVSYDNAGYETAARCPRCDRGPAGLPRYRGTVTLRAEEEIIARRQEREEIVHDGRRARRTEKQVEAAAEELF